MQSTQSTGRETIVQVAGGGGSHLDIANYREMLWGQQGKQPGARCRVTQGAAGRGADPFGTTSRGVCVGGCRRAVLATVIPKALSQEVK